MNIDPVRRQQFDYVLQHNDRMPSLEDFESHEAARDFVNWCLEGSYSEESARLWWNRPRKQLGNLTPEEAWPDHAGAIVDLATRLFL